MLSLSLRSSFGEEATRLLCTVQVVPHVTLTLVVLSRSLTGLQPRLRDVALLNAVSDVFCVQQRNTRMLSNPRRTIVVSPLRNIRFFSWTAKSVSAIDDVPHPISRKQGFVSVRVPSSGSWKDTGTVLWVFDPGRISRQCLENIVLLITVTSLHYKIVVTSFVELCVSWEPRTLL